MASLYCILACAILLTGGALAAQLFDWMPIFYGAAGAAVVFFVLAFYFELRRGGRS